MNMSAQRFDPVLVIPVFDHEQAIGPLMQRLVPLGVPCLLVDDGSGEPCARTLDALVEAHRDAVKLLRLPRNAGKGAAVMAGMREAGRQQRTHVLQIDADGQHQAADVPGFLDEARVHPQAIICGAPIYDDSVPKARLYGRYLTHVWVWINTLSFQIRDSMCGFRVYPLASTLPLIERESIGQRMDFDTEILVRLHWSGVPVRNRLTRVTYPEDGISHFDALRDNLRISAMHARLFFGMLRRLPGWLASRWGAA